MLTSQEINLIPEYSRKIRIYIDALESSVLDIAWGGSYSTHRVEPGDHTPLIIDHGNETNNLLKIICISGNIKIGNVEINHSWSVNEHFYKHYPEITSEFLKTGCDISTVSSKFIKDLSKYNFFESTGDNNFSAITNLKSKTKVNNRSVENNEWIDLSQAHTFTCEIFVTTPADPVPTSYTLTNNEINNHNIRWIYKYDKTFIDNLDTRFYEYVDKKLNDWNIEWSDDLFSGYKIPYSFAVRIQSQLIDNKEFIKDRHVVDLGTLKGQFLYPCIELGCASVIGAQPMDSYNQVITSAFQHLGLGDIARSIWGDAYDLEGLKELCKNKDTLLVLGLIYHLNNHYQLLETITKSDISALVIDSLVLPYDYNHYVDTIPCIKYFSEPQNQDSNGWELHSIKKDHTWIGKPNASWLINTLSYMGWKIKSITMSSSLRLNKPQYRHRGVITAYR